MTFGQEYPHAPARDSEHRHGAHRPDRVQRRGDRAHSVPRARCCPTPSRWGANRTRPDVDRLPHRAIEGRQGSVRTISITTATTKPPCSSETGTQAVRLPLTGVPAGAGRFDVGQGGQARCRRVQRRGVRSRIRSSPSWANRVCPGWRSSTWTWRSDSPGTPKP